MDLKTLVFSVALLNVSVMSFRVSHGQEVSLISDKRELSQMFMEVQKPKKRAVTVFDYDGPDDLPRDTGREAGAAEDLPTCLLCVCLIGSVYCEDVSPEMTSVPALPKETAYLYARYNKITKITSKDFAETATLRTIDLTGNLISEIEEGAFSKLHQLEELTLADNKLTKLPVLPASLVSFNANGNQLKTKGVKSTAFKKLTKVEYIYLANNDLEAVPQLPESLRIVHLQNNKILSINDETFCKGNNTHYIRYNMEEIRMDGNPVMLAQHPTSYMCLRVLPVGLYK
ncbi:mimecan-like [Denticeps clupeoides]|uniref:mimecan-like n=1 Tax=Denticeps clupeoides TaxID=299321 RepID=UPI0010A2D574|nr:mimecan-like [Denticeps clupeoides]